MGQWIVVTTLLVSLQLHAGEIEQSGENGQAPAPAAAALPAPDMSINRSGLTDSMKAMGQNLKTLYLGLIKDQGISDADLLAAATSMEQLALTCPAKAPSHMLDANGHVKADQMSNFLAFHDVISKLPGLVANLKAAVAAKDKVKAKAALQEVMALQKAGHEQFKQ